MEPYLFHGIKWYNYELLNKILESGFILPRNMLEEGLVTDKNNIFNGTKFISLCQNTLGPDYTGAFRSSYDDFIFNKPSLILENKNINIIFPNIHTIYEKDMMSREEWNEIIFKDDDERHTYYIDEVQTKDKISLRDNLKAVGIPLEHLDMNYSKEEKKEYLNKLRKLLDNIRKDIPIVNSSNYDFGNNEECIKKYTIS